MYGSYEKTENSSREISFERFTSRDPMRENCKLVEDVATVHDLTPTLDDVYFQTFHCFKKIFFAAARRCPLVPQTYHHISYK